MSAAEQLDLDYAPLPGGLGGPPRSSLALFEAFDRAHPEVYAMFVERALRVAAIREHYSARTIMEVIRFHTTVDETRSSGFKINNNYTPFYVRKFEREYPQYRGFFEKRRALADGEERER